MEGKASTFDGDTHEEVSVITAVNDSIPNCVGLTWEKWYKKEVIMVNKGGEGVTTGFVEFAWISQTLDRRLTLGDNNIRVAIYEVIQEQSLIRCHSLLSWPRMRTLYQGVSLDNHLRKESSIKLERALPLGNQCESRKYASIGQIPGACLPK